MWLTRFDAPMIDASRQTCDRGWMEGGGREPGEDGHEDAWRAIESKHEKLIA